MPALGAIRWRLVFAILGCFGMAIIYGLKVNLHVNIVAMLNKTAIRELAAKEHADAGGGGGDGAHGTVSDSHGGGHGGGHKEMTEEDLDKLCPMVREALQKRANKTIMTATTEKDVSGMVLRIRITKHCGHMQSVVKTFY